ncbi:MAG: hypothetical protein ACLT33_10920 [Lachnospira pectinoschiza]
MKKRFNFTSALTVVLSSALIAMTTLPVLASNTNYDFDFSFDAGNTCVTSTEYKETRYAITMYCTWEEGVSGSSYAVRPREDLLEFGEVNTICMKEKCQMVWNRNI